MSVENKTNSPSKMGLNKHEKEEGNMALLGEVKLNIKMGSETFTYNEDDTTVKGTEGSRLAQLSLNLELPRVTFIDITGNRRDALAKGLSEVIADFLNEYVEGSHKVEVRKIEKVNTEGVKYAN